MRISSVFFVVSASAAVITPTLLSPSSVRAAPLRIPAFLLVAPQEKPFDNLLLELLYQDLMTIAEEEDLEVYEFVVLAALRRQRFIHSLSKPLPVIPLAGGWRLEPVPLDNRPFLFPEVEELYRELKEAEADGTITAREAAILAFIERTRERILMPIYELVSPSHALSLDLLRPVVKSIVTILPPPDSIAPSAKARAEPWDNGDSLLSNSTIPFVPSTSTPHEPTEQWWPAPAGPAVAEPASLAVLLIVILSSVVIGRVAGRRS